MKNNEWHEYSDEKVVLVRRKEDSCNSFEVIAADGAEENGNPLDMPLGEGDVRFLHTVIFVDDYTEKAKDALVKRFGFNCYDEFRKQSADSGEVPEQAFASFVASEMNGYILMPEAKALERIQSHTGMMYAFILNPSYGK